MHRQTKATAIPKAVKIAVYCRDGFRCVLCGSNQGEPNAHIVPRSHGGKGIEQNVVTLCHKCHRRYDQTTERRALRAQLEQYIKQFYPDWDEKDMIYRKYEFEEVTR